MIVLRMLFTILIVVICVLGLEGRTHAQFIDEEGIEYVNISECSDQLGFYTSLGGNISHPLSAYDSAKNYFAFIKEEIKLPRDPSPARVVVTQYDGEECTEPTVVTTNFSSFDNPSHAAPTSLVDGNGYIYVTNNSRIYRSMKSHDISSFQLPSQQRMFQGTETNGFLQSDGSIMFTASDMHSLIDIIDPYPGNGPAINYRWPEAKQVLTMDVTAKGSPVGCESNRFTKGVFSQGVGSDTNLYLVWGWARGGLVDSCSDFPAHHDSQHYVNDSHEVFFAYSDDGGLTWRNINNTKATKAAVCPSKEDCWKDISKGIVHNDDDYRITETRQREHRKLWADPDGTIYIAFAKSVWCDSGVCGTSEATATDPGALKLLKFRLGDNPADITEVVVNHNTHSLIGAIRKDAADGALYIWALETHIPDGRYSNDIYEYVSTDDGQTWSRSQISEENKGYCLRVHGDNGNIRLQNSVRLAWSCNLRTDSSKDELFYYRRSFNPNTPLPAGWTNTTVGTHVKEGFTTYLEDGTFHVHGAGEDIRGTQDQFRFVYQEHEGDVEIVSQIMEVEETDGIASAGVMIRESAAEGARHAFIGLRAGHDWGTFKHRENLNDVTMSTVTETGVTAPYWVKLNRNGDTFEGYISINGEDWNRVGSATIPMNSKVQVGLAVMSRDNEQLNTSTFSKVSISGESGTGSIPGSQQRDVYIVRPGDTLSEIARIYNTSWQKLQQFNQISNPHLIVPNQEIRWPND